MNVNGLIDKSLEKQNMSYHESSSCDVCTPDTAVPNARWCKLDALSGEKFGIPVFRRGEDVLLLPLTHTLVTGSSGTGKSEVFYKNFINIISRVEPSSRPSLLITDLKGDISRQTKKLLEASGYTTLVFDMRNSYNTASYNFLTQLYDDYTEACKIKKSLDENKITEYFDGVKYSSVKEARAVASAKRLTLLDFVERTITDISHIIIASHDPKDKSWCEGARTMLRAILWTLLHDSECPTAHMTRKKFTISNVCRTAFSTDEECEDIINWLRRAEDNLTVKNALASNYDIKAKVTRDGYVSTINTALAEYSSNSIKALTRTSGDIDLRKIASGDKPYAIYVITDERQKSTNSICMMLINNLINELMNVADKSDTGALSRDFIILADEFANMPPLPNLTSKITTLRSRRIWMVMAIQSIQQLDMVYGKEASAVLVDNCDLHVFLGCNNDETKEAFARSMGKRIGVKTSFNISNSGNLSVNKGTEDVPVIRKSDLDALTLGEFYIRSRQCKNMKCYMTPYFMLEEEKVWFDSSKPSFSEFDPDENIYDIIRTTRLDPPERKKGYGF